MFIWDIKLLSPIKYVLGNGIRKLGRGVGKTILYGSGLVTGADAALNLRQKYLDQQKNNPNNHSGSSSSNNSNSNSNNNNTNPKPNNPSSNSNAQPSNTPTTKASIPNSAPTSTPVKSSSLLLLVLSYLDINVSENSSDMFNLLSSLLTLELLVLLGFINIIFYLISYILYLKYDIETKFSSPKIKKVIRFYVKSSIYFILF